MELDILIATEPSPLLLARLPTVAAPTRRPGRDGLESWVAIVGPSVEPCHLDIPYERMAAAALTRTRGGDLLIYGSVLPWRSAPRQAPELALPNETASAMFERVLGDQERDLFGLMKLHPAAMPIWAGDFNQSLGGGNWTGSGRGRHLLEESLARLGLEAWNRHSPHARPDASAIDLVCGPKELAVKLVETFNPKVDGRRLSDHAGYIVDVEVS